MYNDKRVSVRDFRKQMKSFLDGSTAVSIGSPWQIRAIVVPLGNFHRWDNAAQKKAFAKAKREFAAILAAERE